MRNDDFDVKNEDMLGDKLLVGAFESNNGTWLCKCAKGKQDDVNWRVRQFSSLFVFKRKRH